MSILTLINMALATYYITTTLLHKKTLMKLNDKQKVQVFAFSILFGLYLILGTWRVISGGVVTHTELFFWKVFDFILILQGIVYLLLTLKEGKTK